jgi:2-(1,2-epoxy-1,2-dihydrophenyl)acetyl-CoA isomerase
MMSAENNTVYADPVSNHVLVIYLNQPEKKNALSRSMMDELRRVLLDADADPAVRVVLLRGAGRDFSSGGDLSQDNSAGLEAARVTLRSYSQVIRTMRRMAKPIIAMVEGYAVGGAFSLVLAADLVCASQSAVFIPAFCQIGIVPEMGMMKYLPELVGQQRAKEIVFLGARLDAVRLAELGLVNRLYAPEELEQGTLEMARQLADMPDASIQITKGILNSLADSDLDVLLEAELTASPFCTATTAYAEAIKRFRR